MLASILTAVPFLLPLFLAGRAQCRASSLPAFAFLYAPAGPSIFTATLDFPGITQASPKRRERVLRSGAARPIMAF
jgi:hypothetical protein